MTKRMSEEALIPCEVCGKPLRSDNKVGICSTNPACLRARLEKDRRLRGVKPKQRGRSKCTAPEGCTEDAHGHGLCQMHTWRLAHHGHTGEEGLSRRPITVEAGATFGRWTALGDNGRSGYVTCQCECGTVRAVMAHQLVTGKSASCGCAAFGPRPRPEIPYVSAGEPFGRLLALEDAWKGTDRIRFRCQCGTESVRDPVPVKGGKIRSCGCLQREWKHGLSYHPLYGTWKGMIDRTTNPDSHNWNSYGGRGITVCERWQGNPQGLRNFIADVGERPTGRTLDRIDNEGPYAPGNVRWATPGEQNENRRTIASLTAERDELAATVASLQERTGMLF